MKKLSFILGILLLASGVCYAQSHVDVITQEGPSNTGYIYQSGTQSNFGQIITVGSTNDGYIYQSNNGFGGAGLEASIFQNGDNNHGYVDQGISGQTFGHDAVIDQDGNWNKADITQINGQPSTAYIRQYGIANDADQIIYSDGQQLSSAYIWQEGDNNISYQNLGMGGFVSGSSFAATQVGSSNKSYQYIYSNEPWPMGGALKTINNHGTINTYGDNNSASQEMKFNADGNNWGNTATIVQLGDWNTATQSQVGTGHISTITQNGFGNSAQSVQN